MDSQKVLRQPFDIETHKLTFINYLEVVILEDGTIEYAIPSHQEKVINVACQKLGISRDELNDLCPVEYYFNFMTWLCMVSGCVSLWNEHMVGQANDKQAASIHLLKNEGLYRGAILVKPKEGANHE